MSGELLGHAVVVRGTLMGRLTTRDHAEAEATRWLSESAVVAEVRAVATGEEIRAARQRAAAEELIRRTAELGLYRDTAGEFW